MKSKKNPKIVSEKLKISHTLTGLNFVLGLVLASFSYGVTKETPNKNKSIDYNSTIFLAEEKPKKMVQPQVKQKPKPKKEKVLDLTQEVKIEENIEEDLNEEIVEESDVVEEGDSTFITNNDVPVLPIGEATNFPDVEAGFIGGLAAWKNFLLNELEYPEMAIEFNEQGKVYLSFVIELDGSINEVKVLRGVSTFIDREAVRVIKKSPKWKPGILNGKPVRTMVNMPINFVLR